MDRPELPRWIPAPVPPNETQRLAALKRYEILDSPPEDSFDRITRIAAHVFEVPMALVSLVDDARQWFKSHHGLDATCTPRSQSFCAYTILLDAEEDLFIVEDAAEDDRFADSPLVASNPDIRFYAGVRLRTSDNWNLGSLCLIDQVPKSLSEEKKDILRDLGALTMDIIETHHASRQATSA